MKLLPVIVAGSLSEMNSRRSFIRSCGLTASALALTPVLGCRSTGADNARVPLGPATRTLSLNRDWLFGGKFELLAETLDQLCRIGSACEEAPKLKL